jgi:16S rRNA (adenine1518-N6/adenine1519-N6)-dimethyltransferase
LQVNPPPLDIPGILRRHNLRPNKRLGQNFLVDPTALQSVVEAANLQACDNVLEIGPGLGSLTRLLAARVRRVVAVELDPSLILPLKQVIEPYSNVQIIQGDILAFDPTRLMSEPGHDRPSPYLVVANIPYYITSALIRRLLETGMPPNRLVLTVQREVAERICAAPGEMSLLALSVQIYGKPYLTARIPCSAFYPLPKVDSSVVRVDIFTHPSTPSALVPLLFRLAKAGFSQKRKTLRNALSGGMRWTSQQTTEILGLAEIDPQRRAETLSIQEWVRLAEITAGLTPKDK